MGTETKKKSPLITEAIKYLKDILKSLENDECSEEQIGCILGRLNAENKGYFNDNSFVNYDEAMRILKIKSRERMVLVLKRHGVKMNVVNNHKVGFLRSEVEAVATLEQQPQSKRKRKAE
jgi:hypothetical protein